MALLKTATTPWPAVISWQRLVTDPPPVTDEVVMVFYDNRPTLGIYLSVITHRNRGRGWRVSVSPGTVWTWVRTPPTHWASLPLGPEG
jgi:hypothetical protein